MDLFGKIVDLFYKIVDLLNEIEDIFSNLFNKAVDIEPKVGSIIDYTIEPKVTGMAIIILISVEIIANTKDIRLVSCIDSYY